MAEGSAPIEFWSWPDPDPEPLYAPGDRSPQAVRARRQAIHGESFRRRTAGTFGAFTDQEMDRARDLTHYAGPSRAEDPVAAILGHPSDQRSEDTEPADVGDVVVDEWAGGPRVHFITHVDLSGLQASMRQAAEKMAAAFGSADVQEALNTIQHVVTGYDPPHTVAVADDDPPEVLNRRRHGNAATCPRHGETKGGLCRRCR